jgi:hypothetical protein
LVVRGIGCLLTPTLEALMRKLLLGFALATAVAFALRGFFAAPPPSPSWEETENDPEDLSRDLAERARQAEAAADPEEQAAS